MARHQKPNGTFRNVHDRISVQQIETIGPKEGRVLFDKAAKFYLGISGDEFIRKWDAGEYREVDTPNVVNVAMLLPFARK